MSIINLPNEVLREILYYLMPNKKNEELPNSLDGFSNTCRHFRLLAEPMLREHKDLKAKYSTLIINPEDSNLEPALKVLNDMWMRPQIALYPRSMEVTGQSSLTPLPRPDIPFPEILKATVLTSGLTQFDRCWEFTVDYYMANIRKGSIDCIVAFILASLPNLQRLRLQDMYHERHYILNMVDDIAIQANTRTKPPRALSKLSEVWIGTDDLKVVDSVDFGENREHLAMYGSFTMLPSMRCLQGNKICGCWGVSSHRVPRKSPITHIEFNNSAVDGTNFRGLLMLIGALRSFSYRPVADRPYTKPYSGVGRRIYLGKWDPQGIRNGLLSYAKDTLEELNISAAQRGRDRFLGTLRHFKVLRIVIVDSAMFIKNGGEMQRLVDVLPASIEHIRMIGALDLSPMKKFWADFQEPIDYRVPNLQEVMIGDQAWYLGSSGVLSPSRLLASMIVP